jgi:hypothetical protein
MSKNMEKEIELLKAKIKVLELELEILKGNQNIPQYPVYPINPIPQPYPQFPWQSPFWYEHTTCGGQPSTQFGGHLIQ